jgi:hypothetical protein
MSSIATSEYMKIRRYVMNLIHLSMGEAAQIPTVQELCSQFNVSRPTVCKAMKALTEDGYVIARRGIGSFTNPNKGNKPFNPIEKKLPIIGIITGDGMMVHYSSYIAPCLGALLKSISWLPSIVHLLSLSSSDPEQIYRDINNERLDALLWLSPGEKQLEVCRRLLHEKFPLVLGQKSIEYCPSVSFDFEGAGYNCGKILIAEGRRNVIFYPNVPPQSEECDGLKRAYQEAGIALNESLFLEEYNNAHEKICEIMAYGIPVDAIYGLMMPHNEVEDYLLQFDSELYKRCMMVASGVSFPSTNPFQRLEYEIPFDEYGQECALMLGKLLSGIKEVEHRKLKISIKSVSNNLKT